jgi:transposase, IS6 family
VKRVRKNRPTQFRGRHFEDEVIVLCVRWYLRYSLSYHDLKEMMAERGLAVDHSTVWRWVQRYAPMLNQRLSRELRRPNRSWRVDETYVRVAGRWTYLYRAVDSEGNTIDFMLSPHRDLIAAKYFLQLALCRTKPIRPRVINVDGHPAYARAITELKGSGELSRRCRCRPSPYLNHILEQDHRFVKKRIAASLWFRSIDGALNTIDGYEAMHIEIGEDFVFEDGPVRQVNADRSFCVGVGRLDVFRIGFVQPGEIVGSHKGSVAPMSTCGGGRNRVMLCE